MSGTQRMAAVAAVSHSKHYYNHTNTEVHHSGEPFNVNVFLVSATLCGVIVAVCVVCWRRVPAVDKPDDIRTDIPGAIYTVSADARLQTQEEPPGPPPAYDSVVQFTPPVMKDDDLQEVLTESCTNYRPLQLDGELPSYEAAVLLRDTKL